MSAAASSLTTDVLVVGGGPSGSTVAALLTRRGRQVLLVEKDRHPRFHIGESLLPMNLPILDRLGVLDQVAAIGVRKPGADFPAGNERGYNVFRFERTFNPGYPYAFQVKRAEFDELLFRHAAANGVDAREGVRISELAFDAGGVSARGTAADGTVLEVRARYLVDATGRDTLLGAKLGLKRKHAKHQSAALFAHFRGVTRRSGEDEGNISVYRFEHGWVWMIPLRDGLMSVGAVCRPEYLKQRRGRNAEFLLETLRAIPAAWARMERAEIADHLHVTGNYSYECRELAGRRWIMVGDAFAFVDPIFSSGVFLAMNSAEHAARLIHEVLDAPQRERALQREYARTQRRGVHEFSWFIYRFTAPPMRHLFANPRNVWGVEQAMISMLAGDVFDNGGVRRRLRLFKVLYYLRALAMLPQALRSWFDRRRQLREAFAGGTTSQDHG